MTDEPNTDMIIFGRRTVGDISQDLQEKVPRVLVADDENAILEVVQRGLQKNGYLVDIVSNGVQALEAYKAAVENNKPQHIIKNDKLLKDSSFHSCFKKLVNP